jgi:O-antigen/teichoic acid export membrane protein
MADSAIVKRNAAYNLLGAIVPMLVAVISLPLLISGLGLDRFGLLTISWAVIGYFALFDIGLGRAVTQSVARRLETDAASVTRILWTALVLAGAMGVTGGLALSAAASTIAHFVAGSTPELAGEMTTALSLLAGCVPVLTLSSTLRGFLEAQQRFDLVNAVRVPNNVATFLGPLVVLPYSNALDDVALALIVARLCALAALAVLTVRVQPDARRPAAPDVRCVRELMSFGGWLTVTNVVGPILVYADRFAVAGLVSSAALAFYVTPWEVVTRLLVVPGALMSALFPAISATYAVDETRSIRQFQQTNHYVALFIFPVALLLVAFCGEGLTLWLGAEFAAQSTFVMRALSIGLFFNAFGSVATSFIQGTGRPDLTARVHLWELPFYLTALIVLIPRFGVNGAAIAWASRVALDALILQFLTWRVLHKEESGTETMRSAIKLTPMVGTIVAGGMLYGVIPKIAFCVTVLLAFTIFGWRSLLTPQDRALVGHRVTNLLGKLR